MKNVLFTLMLIVFSISIYAQDIITKKNGDEIKAKVQKIGTTEIEYKKIENLDGPSYTIAKSEVFIIKYENGTKDIINEINNTTVEKPIQATDKGNKDFSRVYIKIGGGYGLNLTPSDPDYEITVSNKITYKSKSCPYGNGINFGSTFGLFFSKIIGVELGISYLLGDKTEITNTYAYGSQSDDLSKQTVTLQGKMLWLKPAIILTPGFKKVNPYMTFGLIYGYGKVIENYTELYFNNSGGAGDVYKMTWEDKGGYALGTVSSLGMNIPFAKHFSCFAELRYFSANYIPFHAYMTKVSLNGADWLANFSKHNKQIDYVGSYTNDNNSGNPSKSTRISMPFDSFGINVGINISF